MTNGGKSVGDDRWEDLPPSDGEAEDSEITSDDPDHQLPIIAEAWTVYVVTVPKTDNHQFCSRHRKQEWEVTRHNSCRSSLQDAAWNWIENSSDLCPGDSVWVTDYDHDAFDTCGEVLKYNIGSHVVKVQLVEAVEGRRVGNVHRTMITKIHGTRNHLIKRCPVGVQNLIYMENFVDEANLEINRLSRFAFTTEDSGSDRNQNGRRVFIGDLVYIVDNYHDYNGWIVMVSGIRLCGMLQCTLGIPPSRERQTDESDKRARMNRPLDRNCLVGIKQCKVWGPNNHI